MERFHGNGKKDAGGGRGRRVSGVARQESVLRESKVLYIERRKKRRRKRRDGRERGTKEKNGDRTNAARKVREKERDRERKRKRKKEKETWGKSTSVRRGGARGIPEDGRRVVSTITNTAP